ncbi:family 78 glycoside hydrolase catalytic domain [uncultured Fibrella sp.]|uniref:family 78 glycoside hydrolase catalytic domain n=1 Tax=uncultured Fibrella sp. TaxID=1284596 RepID=UPI0035C95C3E
MKNQISQLLVLLLAVMTSHAQVSPVDPLQISRLRCNYQVDPLGVETPRPALSWQLVSAGRNQKQTAYRVLVADNAAALANRQGNLWDSGKQVSDQSIQVAYGGKPLLAGKVYYWMVQVWDQAERLSAWSAPASWQMGLLTNADWGNARWIALSTIPDSARIVPFIHAPEEARKLGNRKVARHALPQFRKELTVVKPLKRATAFISGLGHYELSLNGRKVNDHFLDPGWTNYNQYCLYATYDITASLRKGVNVVGVLLGNGFYSIPNERYRKMTGTFGDPKLIAKLLLEFTDGTTAELVTDQSWKTTASPVTYSSIYGGEDWNATHEQTGWQRAGYQDASWQMPLLVQGPPQVRSQTAPPVKIMDTFAPVRISQPKPGIWIVDLGQNASAIPQISVRGKAGSVVKITPGELLGADSLVTQESSGGPHFYQYTLAGKGTETWHPLFTYFGFRYLQIEGAAPDKALMRQANSARISAPTNPANVPVLTDVRGLHVRSSAETIGGFTSSNELFNKTFQLIDWAIRSNVVSVMTDCPHREKLGWLEETHLMGGSVHYTYDLATLLPKIIQDMQAAQLPNGLIPDIAPEFTAFDEGFRDSPEWGSAGVILPWYAYQWYGDRQLLADSYAMMTKYVDYLSHKATNYLLTHGLGDWYDLGPKHPGKSQLTPKGITATAMYYYDLTILERVATLLGKPTEADRYRQMAAAVKKTFNGAYYNPATRQYGTGSQTANAMPLYMNLTTPETKAAVTENLLKNIRATDYRLTAGDVGYRYLLRALEDAGASEVIYRMNNRSDVPGYGYQLAHGATALTESWSALRDPSNNHFMLGHLAEWFYSGLGGIQQAEDVPAFKAVVIRPALVGDMSSASARYQSPYGLIRSEWQRTDKTITLTVEIPANCTAKVYLPASSAAAVSESGQPVVGNASIQLVDNEKSKPVVAIGSGIYTFTIVR